MPSSDDIGRLTRDKENLSVHVNILTNQVSGQNETIRQQDERLQQLERHLEEKSHTLETAENVLESVSDPRTLGFLLLLNGSLLL